MLWKADGDVLFEHCKLKEKIRINKTGMLMESEISKDLFSYAHRVNAFISRKQNLCNLLVTSPKPAYTRGNQATEKSMTTHSSF